MADYTLFVSVFPEFASASSASAAYWLSQAPLQLNATMFGANFDLASMLFVAHNLTLGKQNANAVARGGVPGTTSGALASKSVGGVSASYDVGGVSIPGAGEWNATSYGRRLYKMMQAAACGGIVRAVHPALGPFVGLP